MRDFSQFYFRFIQILILSILCVSLFWKIPRGNYAELTNYTGYVFFCVMIQLFVGILGSILTFIEERPLFLREQAGRMYNIIPYYLAKDIIELPVSIVAPLFFSVFYFGMGTDVTLDRFLNFYMVQLLVSLATTGYGQVIGSLFDTAETAIFFTPVLMMPFVLFSGFLTNVDTFPKWIGWIQYVSPIRYGFEASMRNEFSDFDLPRNLPDPIKFLNLKLGFNTCMIMLIVSTFLVKIASVTALKLSMKKF